MRAENLFPVLFATKFPYEALQRPLAILPPVPREMLLRIRTPVRGAEDDLSMQAVDL